MGKKGKESQWGRLWRVMNMKRDFFADFEFKLASEFVAAAAAFYGEEDAAAKLQATMDAEAVYDRKKDGKKAMYQYKMPEYVAMYVTEVERMIHTLQREAAERARRPSRRDRGPRSHIRAPIQHQRHRRHA